MEINESYAIRYQGYFYTGLNPLATDFSFKVIGYGYLRMILNGTWIFGGASSYQTLDARTYNTGSITLSTETWYYIEIDYYVNPPEAGFAILWKDDIEDKFIPLSAGVTSNQAGYLSSSYLNNVLDISNFNSNGEIDEFTFEIPVVKSSNIINGYKFDRSLNRYIDVTDSTKYLRKHDLIEAEIGFMQDNRMINFNGANFAGNGGVESPLTFSEILADIGGCQWAFIPDDLNDTYGDGDPITADWTCNQSISATNLYLDRIASDGFQPRLDIGALNGKSIIKHDDTLDYFNVGLNTFLGRALYKFLNYNGTLILLFFPIDHSFGTHQIWGGTTGGTNAGISAFWNDAIERIGWSCWNTSGLVGVANSSNGDFPASTWYLLMFEVDNSTPAVRLYNGTTLINEDTTTPASNPPEDVTPTTYAKMGCIPACTGARLYSDWGFMIGYNKVLSSSEKSTLVSAVNDYYGLSIT